MKFRVGDIAKLLGGTVEGDENQTIDSFAKIEEGVDGAVSFLSNPKYIHHIYTTKSSAIIVSKVFTVDKPIKPAIIWVEDSYSAFAQLLDMYNKVGNSKVGISEKATISKSAIIGKDVFIDDFVYISDGVVIGDGCKVSPFAFIGANTKIGNNCIIHPSVTIYQDVKIGNDCVFFAGSVVGADGFGYAPLEDGTYKKIPQIGDVIIEDGVELGANACVDRATMGHTIIRSGVKLDNMVQIGHNVDMGENTVCSAQTGIAGSVKVGRNTMWGGQSGCANHLVIADMVRVGAQAGLLENIDKEGSFVIGSPAVNSFEFKRTFLLQTKLKDMLTQMKELEKRVKELESK